MGTNSSRQRIERFNCVGSNSLDQLMSALQRSGHTVISLDGAAVTDRASFFEQVAAAVQGSEDAPTKSWDALADWFWQVFSARSDEQVAIVWTDAHVVLEASFATLLTAVHAISDLNHAELGHQVRFVVCLVGDGLMFPPIDG